MLLPPTIMEMANITDQMQEKLDKINFFQSISITDCNSTFTGYCTKVRNSAEVKQAYLKVKQIAPEADHLMMAYMVKQYSGYHDAGEHGAAKKISSILAECNVHDTAIFVAHVYGDWHLGPRRYFHIEKAAKDALNQLQNSLPL